MTWWLYPLPGNVLQRDHDRTCDIGHGQDSDLSTADADDSAVWRWLAAHGAKYGLYPPLPGADPAHVQPRANWHKLAVALRVERVGGGEGTRIAKAAAVKTRYAHADR